MVAKYKITDLGTLGSGDFSWASGINDHGQVTGNSTRSPEEHCSASVAFFKGFDGLTELSPFEAPAYQTCHAHAINNQGKVCGQAGNPGMGSWDHPCLWSYGDPIDLGSAGYATAINNHNQILITGWNGYNVAIWECSGKRDILVSENMINCAAVNGNGLNDCGQIVGNAHIGGNEIAYLWEMGSYYELNDFCNSAAYLISAEDINNKGHIVGEARFKGDATRPFILENGGLKDLGSIGFNRHKALKINEKGQIIGQGYQSNISRDEYAAFFCRKNEIIKIDDMLTREDSEWHVVEANDINNQGQIVGTGIYAGQRKAILLNPV